MKIPGKNLAQDLFSAARRKFKPGKAKEAETPKPEKNLKEKLRENFLGSPGAEDTKHVQDTLNQKGEVSIGRSTNNDFVEDDGLNPLMSNKHAKLELDQNQLKIIDTTSSNGTKVAFYPKQGESIEMGLDAEFILGPIPIRIQVGGVNEVSYKTINGDGHDLDKELFEAPIGSTITVSINKESLNVSVTKDGEKIPEDESPVLEFKKIINPDSKLNKRESPSLMIQSVHDENLELSLQLGQKAKKDTNETLHSLEAITDVKDLDLTMGARTIKLRLEEEKSSNPQSSNTAEQVDLLNNRKS